MLHKKIKIIFFFSITSLLIFYIYKNSDFIYDIKKFPMENIITIYILYYLFHHLNTIILSISISPYLDKKRSNFYMLFGINQISSLSNYITPLRSGHVASKIFFLKKYFNIDIKTTISTFLLISIIGIFASSILLITTLIIWYPDIIEISVTKETYKKTILAIIILISLAVIAYLFREEINIEKHYFNIRKPQFLSKKSLVKIHFLLLAQLTISSVIFYFLLPDSENITIPKLVLLVTFGNLISVISLTPGNLGVKELSFIGLSGFLNIESSAMTAAILVDRLIQISFLIIGSGLFLNKKLMINFFQNKPHP